MEIQSVFNDFNFFCFQFFSKTEDRFSQVMKQAAKEAFENNRHHHDTMKTIVNGYLTNRESSFQEEVYHILPELKLRRIFPAGTLSTPIFQRKKYKYCFLKYSLGNCQMISQIFSRNQILITTWKDTGQHSATVNTVF